MSTTPSIIVRALDANYDPIYGTGSSSFVADIEAIRQILISRIWLFTNSWWESLSSGTPMFESILGAMGNGRNPQLVATILQQRILGTPYVTGVSNLAASFNPDTRNFQFSCAVQTQFGTITLSSTPTPPSSSFNS